MPSAADFNTAAIKCLAVGPPGTGKTGSLISILIDDPEARLFVCNFDRANFGTLPNVARFDPKTNQPRDPALVHRLLNDQIQVHHFVDQIGTVNGIVMVTATPTAFTDVGKKLNDWGPPLPAGGIKNLGPKDWLVLDSISAMGDAAMRYALNAAGRLNRRSQQEDWGDAINRLSLFLEMFNDPALPFNIMAITHIRFVGDAEEGKDAKGQFKSMNMVPNAIGQKLPNEIGRYFNNIIEFREMGEGVGSARKIFTKSPGGLVLRSSNPGAVKPEYDVYDGMAKWVRDVRSTPPVAAVATPPAVAPTPATGTPPAA